MHFCYYYQSDRRRKISLAITRQITQEDINVLLTKTTAASRYSQEAIVGTKKHVFRILPSKT